MAKLRFQFRYAPWKEVIEWFAKQADYSLLIPATFPTGTFNYSDDTREYTPAEAIDLLNSVLELNGFMLVRKDPNMLVVVNTTDPFPPSLRKTVSVEALDGMGRSELANVHFRLKKYRPEDVEAEIKTCSDRRDRLSA